MEPALLQEAASLAERGVACALAVVVETHGSVPGKLGATMLVLVDGATRGTVGGAGLEERVKRLARDALATGRSGVHSFDLAKWKDGGLDSVCGGTVKIAIHVVRAGPHLLLVGGGHCAQALARVFDSLGYAYTVVDSRREYASAEVFPNARAVAHQSPAAHLRAAEELPYSHAYLMGHSHHEDGDALIALLERGFGGVIGVIGSKSKMRAFEARARERGVSTAGVRSPIGVDVGAETPAEIAVAVAAEIIRDLRAGRSAGAPEVPDARRVLSNDRVRASLSLGVPEEPEGGQTTPRAPRVSREQPRSDRGSRENDELIP